MQVKPLGDTYALVTVESGSRDFLWVMAGAHIVAIDTVLELTRAE